MNEGLYPFDVAPKNRSSIKERFVLKLNLNHNMNHEEKICRRTNHQDAPRSRMRLNGSDLVGHTLLDRLPTIAGQLGFHA